LLILTVLEENPYLHIHT